MRIQEFKDGTFAGDLGETVALDLKSLTDEGVFEGYGSIFNNVDTGRDMVLPGAFADSLKQRPAAKVKMLWQHDSWQPIGVWEELKEDNRGLYARGRLLTETQRGKEAYALVKAGALDGLSIGYRTLEEEYDGASRVRKLMKVDLREISFVTFPMNESAQISTIKGGEKLPTKRELEQWLVRDAGLPAAKAKALLAGGYKSIHDARDAGADDDSASIEALSQLADLIRS